MYNKAIRAENEAIKRRARELAGDDLQLIIDAYGQYTPETQQALRLIHNQIAVDFPDVPPARRIYHAVRAIRTIKPILRERR